MTRSILLALTIHLLALMLYAQDAQQLRSAVDDWVTKSGNETTAFRHAFTDLDGDGRDDVVVLLRGNSWCGSGGCTMLIFRGTATGFIFVSSSELISEPIRVLSERTSGWKQLIVYVKKVGDVVIPFNGSGYSLDQSGPTATMAQIKAARILMESCCVSLYTSGVRYESFHEQGWITLQDGQTLRIAFGDI